jgi:hypothetical protein
MERKRPTQDLSRGLPTRMFCEELREGLEKAAITPDCNPVLKFPNVVGRVDIPAPAAAASCHLSAILAASLKIRTNISRVSFPVCVFWFEGWYEATKTFPSGSLYFAPC